MKRLALAASLLPATAAASEGESALSVTAGVGSWTTPDPEDDEESIAPTAGGLVGIVYERGFSEALSWRVELGGGLYGGGGLSWSGGAAAGIVYRFDVLKYVPYGLVELGGSIVGGELLPDESVIDPVLQIGGGVDVLQSRDRSWGIEGRLASFLGDTTTFSLSGRYTFRWGYF